MDKELSALVVIFTEFYYWVTVVFMFLIHVGFCMYEVGASRRKNHMHTLMKNTMVIPTVGIGFYLFGWWIYSALPNGPGITGGLIPAPFALPWSELMSAHMGGTPVSSELTAADTALWSRLNGVFFAAFLLFSWTTASIVSGDCIERIRPGGFWILAVLIGSVVWIVDAAWGWHPAGWMVAKLGYHDAYASGVVHAVAGGFTLGVLTVLGPRIGKFRPDGSPRNINPQNPWLVTIGIFLIYVGFWGFYAACNIPMFDIQTGDGVFFSATTIYLTPTSLSAITFNFLMALCGGMLATFLVSKGDAFWSYSGGLAGIIASSAGNDLYHPLQAFLIGAIVPVIAYKLHYCVERRFKLDSAVGAVAIHGYAGFMGVVIAGFMLWGYPSSQTEGFAPITPWGNFAGAVIMFGGLGLLPGYVAAKMLDRMGLLRIPREIELAGLDLSLELQREADAAEMREAVAEEIARVPPAQP